MSEVSIYDCNGKSVKKIKLPSLFETPFRPDLIRRAFISHLNATKQSQGRNPMAGKRTTAESWGPGHGVARVPRVKGGRYPASNKGAFAPMTVSGRLAHPPRVTKKLIKIINKKEKRLAIISAIAATKDRELILKRGHVLENIAELPIIVTDEFETLKTTKEVKGILTKLGVWNDIIRVKERKRVRAGIGKMRGRKYKHPKGPLFVVSDNNAVVKALRNILGVDVVQVSNLSIIHLAPGGVAGRLTIWTESAVNKLQSMID